MGAGAKVTPMPRILVVGTTQVHGVHSNILDPQRQGKYVSFLHFFKVSSPQEGSRARSWYATPPSRPPPPLPLAPSFEG